MTSRQDRRIGSQPIMLELRDHETKQIVGLLSPEIPIYEIHVPLVADYPDSPTAIGLKPADDFGDRVERACAAFIKAFEEDTED